ncbi:hypothetical protein [Pseudobacteroides cellulosolvens]|uniref:Uncharacterized protein n=1 Tax=Pseudobacteroides cellulosolvens ATCC 35603 = DSM 2933 TaxID=398512 RepID=A0A0L6JGL0_9FIRM|nr:hypothetical protein [Pseudobacteroides cellulosolvens]KNY24830.1 hypothetical protein Bccel_0087 [Pseudobacteroides cellulosolvens ATCC 35603 = DSM 2933]
MVRCKVTIGPKTEYVAGMVKITATPKSGDPVYGKYTPSGSVTLDMVKEAADQLIVGKEYFLDFNEVPAVTQEVKPEATCQNTCK